MYQSKMVLPGSMYNQAGIRIWPRLHHKKPDTIIDWRREEKILNVALDMLESVVV